MAGCIPDATRKQLFNLLVQQQASSAVHDKANNKKTNEQSSVRHTVSDKEQVQDRPTTTVATTTAGAATITAAPYSSIFPGRLSIKSITSSSDGGMSLVGTRIVVGGWVKTGRLQGKGNSFCFIALNDGSTPDNLQVVIEAEHAPISTLVQTGTCLVVEGEMKATPAGTLQKVELHADKLLHRGGCIAKDYPIAKARHTLEYLREVMHLRPRTNLISSVSRIRNALAFATHKFFNEKGFVYVHTPLITSSDCEGAGEMFQVTTLLNGVGDRTVQDAKDVAAGGTQDKIKQLKEDVAAQGIVVKNAKDAAKDQQEKSTGATPAFDVKSEVKKLLELKDALKLAEASGVSVGGLARTANGSDIDYSKDFFSRPTFLTVSGQLQAEIYACALTSVYTFGPTFRAENSHTSRHLAEFWMIEPEIAFANLQDDMDCAEDYVKFCCKHLLEACMEDMEFITKHVDKEALNRVKNVLAEPFARCSYTEGVKILEKAVKEGKKKFENEVFWGCDLASEHERYLAEEVFQKPTIVYNYPKEIKAFYMRLNEDKKTVAAMDILVPRVGELVGGSVREERLEVLEDIIQANGLELDDYKWYLELRKFGTVPHAGFGLGFERLILFCTGIENIRDVIPFPRWPGNASF